MKDIAICLSTTPIGKVSSPKKDKMPPKKTKEVKSAPKNSIKGKIPKISMKKAKCKSKESKGKSGERKKAQPRKKSENKAESKKKTAKESKAEKKTLKNTLLEVGRKRKLSQKNHVVKTNGDNAPPPVKIPKVISNCDGNKFVNGNANATTEKPWLLKIDLAPQRPNIISNGISSGPLTICNKSVIIIPKKKSFSKTVVKKNLCMRKDEVQNNDKVPTVTKLSALKSLIHSSKETNRKDSYPDLLQDLERVKKNDSNRNIVYKEPKVVSSKECKILCVPNEQKPSNYKEQKPHVLSSDTKVLFKDHYLPNLKNQKNLSKETKQITAKQDKNASNTIEVNNSKIIASKNQKSTSKETKGSNRKSSSKEEKALCVREPTKIHPQRMASLDAMAKMHVICSTDRRMTCDFQKGVELNKEPLQPVVEKKSITESKSIHIGIEKQTQEFEKHVIHSRINCVKVEESSVSERRDIRTFSISQTGQESVIKRPRGRPRLKPMSESPEPEQPFFKSTSMKQINAKTLLKDFKSKKIIKVDGKKSKHCIDCVIEKDSKKSKKKKDDTKVNKKLCKLENTKSKVKVKETIRMRKTCTYQSVTTVSSHEAVNSVVESCSRLGVTTNFERNETVLTNKDCENKTDIRLNDTHQGSFMPTSDGHCSLQPLSNCCSHVMHPLPQNIIPVAHSQSCHDSQGTNSNSQQHYCDCNFSIPRCNHQHLLHQRNPHECGCCCSNSLMQPMHNMCILAKEANSFVHHPHCQVSPPVSFCSRCHIPTNDIRPHDLQCNWPPVSNCQNRWCGYRGSCHDSPCHQKSSCMQYPVTLSKPTAPSVPCDQSPLDLSLGAGTSQSIGNFNEQSRTSCPNSHCCQDIKRFQSSPHHSCQRQQHCNQHIGYVTNNCSCNHNSDFREKDVTKISSMPSDKIHHGLLHMSPSKQVPEHISLLNSLSRITIDEPNTDIAREVSTAQGSTFGSAKQERHSSIHSRLQLTKKRKFAHGWSWEGDPVERLLPLTNDSIPTPKKCYPAMRHKEGDLIKERDCVLLKSGPKETDLPYVAKVAAFWESEDDGEMMMSLLWYYRPEHTEQGRKSGQMEDEVYASKHRDVNSVACIEDKCYVLTFNEYCRYRANLAMIDIASMSKAAQTVPELTERYPRHGRLPAEYVSPEMIFFCRHVYDFRQKRILKNPT